jgi:hypothetical protein
MKKGTRVSGLFAFLFLLPLCVNATAITFTSSGTINGSTYSDVYVQNSGTIVTMLDGQITHYLGVTYSGVFNMSDGQISAYSINVQNSGAFNISDGMVDIFELAALENSVFTIGGGNVAIDVLKTDSTSIVNIFSKNYNYNSTTQVVSGYLLDGNFFSIAGVDASEYAVLNFVPEPISLFIFGCGILGLRKQK